MACALLKASLFEPKPRRTEIWNSAHLAAMRHQCAGISRPLDTSLSAAIAVDMPEICAWKFVAEIPQEDGRVLPRYCYVKKANRNEAAKALSENHPGANFRIDTGEALTQIQLDEILGSGDTFLIDEIVRCVQP